MNTFKVDHIITIKKDNHCPNCNAHIEASSGCTDRFVIPSPGDASVCWSCQCILIYDENLNTVNPTEEQMDIFRSEPDTWNILQKFRYYIKEFKD